MSRKIAGITIGFLIVILLLSACGGAATQAPQTGPAPTDFPNPGAAGPALNLKGDATAGATVFEKCVVCHGKDGKGGQANPGSIAGTIPPLNPIAPYIKGSNDKEFATNLDLFIEHGGKPAGSSPARSMLAFGDRGLLTPQQCADVIAYVMSLNK